MKYLDLTGLGEVWANIKSYISSKVPTKTSQLQNDSNYATTSQLPSKTSQLTNDSDFTTNAKLATKQDTISDLASIRSGASKGATAVQPSALNNYVDLSSGQTIDGSKVFTNDIRIIKNSPFCYLFSNDYIKGEIPSSNIYQGIRFFDAPTSGSANHITGGFEITYDTTGYTIASINARTYVNNRQVWKSINFRIANDDTRSIDFYPNSDSEINLGTPTNKWKTLNGINPGALSLPGASAINVDTSDGSTWLLDGTTILYTPSLDGWLTITVKCSSANNYIAVSQNSLYNSCAYNASGYMRVILPVYAGKDVEICAVGDAWGYVRLFPCAGNI